MSKSWIDEALAQSEPTGHQGLGAEGRRQLPLAEPGDREQQVLDRIDRARRRRPKVREERVTMSHGSGGKATHTLIEAIFLDAFRNPLLEPLDILQSIYMLMVQLSQGRSEVENQYARVVPWDGNLVALKAIGETMELRPYFEWRGLGFISHSALQVRQKYAAMDAERLFHVPGVRVADPKACQCGEVLKGVLKPWECKVFGTACTPETPIGTCMVSPEGACAAYYNFGRMNRTRVAEAAQVGQP